VGGGGGGTYSLVFCYFFGVKRSIPENCWTTVHNCRDIKYFLISGLGCEPCAAPRGGDIFQHVLNLSLLSLIDD